MSKTERIYIVAGTHKQALRYARDNTLSEKEFYYISDVTKVRGIRDGKFVRVGTWFEMPNINEILSRLETNNMEDIS